MKKISLIQRANAVIAEFKKDFANALNPAEQKIVITDFETLIGHNKALAIFVDLCLEEYKSMLPA